MNFPAFPVLVKKADEIDSPMTNYFGMSLRDYFAAKAMQSLINQRGALQQLAGDKKKTIEQVFTELAYQFADKMLAERDKET